MSYLLRSSVRTRKSKLVPLLIVLGFVLFVGLLHLIRPQSNRGFFYALGSPFWKTEDFFVGKLYTFAGYMGSKESLRAENERLRLAAQSSELTLLSLRQYQEENAKLKALLGREAKERRILAGILAGPPVSLYDTLVVDAGASDGIVETWVAVVDDVAIGFVETVHGKTSLVKLYSAPGQKLAVLIGQSGVRAEAEGRGGGNFLVKLPKDVTVAEGDVVRTLGAFSRTVGVVGLVEAKATDSFQTVLFRTPVNFFERTWIEIIAE